MSHDEDKTRTTEIIGVGAVIGRYRILERIGSGGMGRVYLAEDAELKRRAAVKLVNQRLINPELVKKEIESHRILEHDNIVRLYDAFEYRDDMCIVTEYIRGETLHDHIRTGPMEFDMVRRYANQILDALDYIHLQGIIHSDLKPQNIIIDADENVKIIDFGIARTATAEIAADIKQVRGTLYYMSPEQIDRKPLDIRSDLFAFGVILYELCTGARPFGGSGDNAIMYSILFEDPIPADSVSSIVSPQISALIARLLSKDPDERPGSAHEVKLLFEESCVGAQNTAAAKRHRLAILPFSYPEKDEKSKVMAQGLNNELYSSFLNVQDLDIVSPLKIEPYRKDLVDGSAVRTLLGAEYYLRGTVNRFADRIRIHVILSASTDDTVVWSNKFDGQLGNLFEMIDAIADAISIELSVRFAPKSGKKGTSTPNPEAYELYLLARSYYIKNTKQDIAYAKDILGQALRLDPEYPLACVGMADCLCAEYMNYYDRSEAHIHGAAAWVERALAKSPRLPEAYRSLGRIMHTTGQLEKARSNYIKAVTYKGDYYQAFRSLGWLAVDVYHYDEAGGWVRKALSINSTDIETILLKGLIHLDRKESHTAMNDFTRCLELRPDYGRACYYMGAAHFQLGEIAEAISFMERALALGGDINAPYVLGLYHIASGNDQKAVDVLQRATYYPEIAFLAQFYLGLLAHMHGDVADSHERYEHSYQLCAELLKKDETLLLAKSTACKTASLLGIPHGCRAIVEELRHYAAFDGSYAHELARIYAILGNTEEARRFIDRAVATVRGPSRQEVDNDPVLRYFLR